MPRITIRDGVWLAITIAASVVSGFVSSEGRYMQGYERGRGDNIELREAKYHLELAKACLKKHGLEPRCADE